MSPPIKTAAISWVGSDFNQIGALPFFFFFFPILFFAKFFSLSMRWLALIVPMIFGRPLLVLAAATDDDVAAIETLDSDRGCAFCSPSQETSFFLAILFKGTVPPRVTPYPSRRL